MLSYVYMKLLESQPRRYDRGVALLSLGHSERARRQVVKENVHPADRVLEIGCGTGTAAILSAQIGARVLGFDVSGPMLTVARAKVAAVGLEDSIDLVEMSVSGMDELGADSFDVVISTLVFSELSVDEQTYALHQAFRVLRPGGRIALADEARPRGLWTRLLHGAVQVPLQVVTFALTQTSTKAVVGLSDLVRQAGFRVVTDERSNLDSFLYLVAIKESGS